MNVYELPIEELGEDPKNANKGTERGRAMLGSSVQDTGLHRGVAVDKKNRLIAGNKTKAAALAAGYKKALGGRNGWRHADRHQARRPRLR